MTDQSEARLDNKARLGDALPLVKARLIGEGKSDPLLSNQVEVDDNVRNLFDQAGAIEPPYDQEMLCLLFEHSSGLRPNVDSYATNIDGFGYRFEPAFRLDAPKDRDRIKTLLARKPKKIEKSTRDNNAAEGTPVPPDDELEAELGELGQAMIEEKSKLDRFFENCCDEHSFVKLRRLTRQDLEVMGNGYWEVLRNREGQIAQFVYVAGFTVRITRRLPPVEIERRVRVDELNFETVKRRKHFRKFVQVFDGQLVYFKEFGDPRLISAKTGKIWGEQTAENFARMQAEEGKSTRAATEIKHFKIDSPRSVYGIPRWIGTLLSVFGSRLSEEVNFLYFDNKSVPPLAVLVSGGRISEDSVSRIESYIQNNLKGKRNFHKILVLEAEPAVGTQQTETSARMRIELRPLTGAQQSDALFQKYDERNLDKIGGSFRLPRLLRGDIRDFNRSTAMAALNFAEMQVFQPEREDFDWEINKDLLVDMGVRFWKFVSRAPVTRDPVALSEMIRNLANGHVLTPEESRELSEDVFNREFAKLDAEWTKQPMALTLAGLGSGSAGAVGQALGEAAKAAADGGEELPVLVERLVRVRKLLAKAEERAAEETLRNALGWDDMEREVIHVPAEEMERMIGADESSASASTD